MSLSAFLSIYADNLGEACAFLPDPVRFPAMALLFAFPLACAAACACAPAAFALAYLTRRR